MRKAQAAPRPHGPPVDRRTRLDAVVSSQALGLTVRAVQPVIAGIEALGYPVDILLDEAGIPPQSSRTRKGERLRGPW